MINIQYNGKVMIYKLYTYPTKIDLLIDNGGRLCLETSNSPMNNQKIKIHKGVDNTITFRVFNRDRKPQTLKSLVIRALMNDPITKERIIDKTCDLTSDTGIFEFSLREGEIKDVRAGLYDLVITGETELVYGMEGEVTGTPFYVDHNNNIKVEIEITEESFVNPAPTTILKDFVKYTEIPNGINLKYKLYSSAVPASRVSNHIDPTHSIAIYMDKFRGNIKVVGSLDHNPPVALSEWFPIDVSSIDDKIIIDEPTSGVFHIAFQAQLMWMKFIIEPDEGSIQQIMVRS